MPAIAIFIKTPGLSPIKTRLAADVGPELALAIYRASVDCVRASVDAACATTGLTAYWAVAEPAGVEHWSGWPVLVQPNGDLGKRMAGIYSQLRERHGAALLLGADIPGIAAELIVQATEALAGSPARVIAPAADGGFALFGANVELAAGWSDVPYGAPDTALRFLQRVGDGIAVTTLGEQVDLDTLADLRSLRARPPLRPTSPQQAFWSQLGDWVALARPA